MKNVPALAIPPTLTPAELRDIRQAVAFLEEKADDLFRDDGLEALRLARALSAVAARLGGRR